MPSFVTVTWLLLSIQTFQPPLICLEVILSFSFLRSPSLTPHDFPPSLLPNSKKKNPQIFMRNHTFLCVPQYSIILHQNVTYFQPQMHHHFVSVGNNHKYWHFSHHFYTFGLAAVLTCHQCSPYEDMQAACRCIILDSAILVTHAQEDDTMSFPQCMVSNVIFGAGGHARISNDVT